VRLFGVFGEAARLYVLLWRHSLPAAALALGAVWLAETGFAEIEGGWSLVLGLVALALSLTAPMLVQGMLIILVEDIHEGRRATELRTLVRSTLPELPSLAGASIVYFFGVVFGLVLLILPGLLALARWSLMAPLIVLERRDIGEARQRSSGLVSGCTGPVLVIMLVLGVVEYGVPELVSARVTSNLAYYAVGVVVTPYVAHVLSALYYRVTDPERPVIALRRPGSPWDEHALEDARRTAL
jgi:hypothetical protein